MHRPIFMSPAQMGAFLARFDPGGRHKWVSPAQKIPGGRERGKWFISLRRKKGKIPVIDKERIAAAKKAYGNFTNDSGPTSGKRI